MGKALKETLLVSIVTIFIEILITKLLEMSTLKEILISICVSIIISLILYFIIRKLTYEIKKFISLFIKNQETKNEFEKYYNIVYDLYNNANYQEQRTIDKLEECVDYIFQLFLDKTKSSISDEIQQNLIENITIENINDYLEKCYEIISEFKKYRAEDCDITSRIIKKINNIKSRLILLDCENYKFTKK